MSNLLAIPFKKTYPIDLKEVVRHYIHAHGGVHPDEFREDLNVWQTLRNEGIGCVPRVERINASLLYHAHLVSILTKLPADIGLPIAYAPVFEPNAIPVTLNNLIFERCGVLFNLTSLYSQLAVTEDRSRQEGIKRATSNYQSAAGVLSYLASSALPKLNFSHDDERVPLDLSEKFIKSLELLMLAQAQECSWQLAKLNNCKHGLIAKIAAKASSLYESAAQAMRSASPSKISPFPTDWLPHIESKACHFAAVAQYRKSIDEIENNRYGIEIARLLQAQSDAKRASEIARRGRVAASVTQDIQSLMDIVQSDLARAQRDNDLIYHHDVPIFSALPSIIQTNLVNPTVPPSLVDPTKALGKNRLLFSELVGWGTREAINIYNERKATLLGEKLKQFANKLEYTADEFLRLRNLPAALEALERPIGLPPSLIKKAQEIRLEHGPARIERSLEDIEKLAQQDCNILNEAMDILDNEALEDEAARNHRTLNRLPSHEVNMELIEKEKRYRNILTQAAASDETVRQKWDEWEKCITELTWSEEKIEAPIPSSTMPSSQSLTLQGKQTQVHAHALRAQIEELEDLHRTRDQIVRRAEKRAATDNIRNRISQFASGFEKLVDVEPAMFEDVLDEELAKYDKFLTEMNDAEKRQNTILADIERLHELFLQSRKDDPVIKEREHALQSLDLAYHMYREITRNLDEGFKFYNNLATLLIQFKEACKTWSHSRNQEVHSLTQSFAEISVGATDHATTRRSSPLALPGPTSSQKGSKMSSGMKSSGLPPLTSSEWGFEEVRLPPPPTK